MPKLFIEAVNAPLFHRYEYPDIPPVGVAVALPLLIPPQLTFTPATATESPKAGCVMITEAVAVQELASITVTS